jgi:hypothetical protein
MAVGSATKMTAANLVFRRQFLMAPNICSSLGHWQHINVGQHHLYAHPDIEVTTVASVDAEVTVTLLGYIVDPNWPDKSNADILSTIANIADSVESIGDYLCSVSGRFVLIISTARETLLFHDPCGLRRVCYTQFKGGVFVGSQPSILKEVLPLKDGARLQAYTGSSYATTHIEHWIPSGCSLFEDVYYLIPNHYLRFSTLGQTRYWPKQVLPRRRADGVVAEASDLLKRLMVAANKRFKLALPLTAGWDSRILLGASKSICNTIYFYTLQYRDLDRRSDDIRIPAKLLRSLGLSHSLIDCRNAVVPDAFRDTYVRNAALAHMHDWGTIAYGMSDAYPQDRVCIKGSCCEIARCSYYRYGTHQPISSPDQLMALERGWYAMPFVRDQISSWYHRVRAVAEDMKVDILDLFYWEHRMGAWQAQSQLEWDIVHETYTPFNHRGLLELMLGVPAKLRSAPHYSLYRMILTELWPEVLRQPMNRPTAKRRVANILGRAGMYERAKGLYRLALTGN